MMAKKSLFYHYLGSFLAALSFVFLFIYMLPMFGVGDVGMGAIIQSPVYLISAAALVLIMPILVTWLSKRNNTRLAQEYTTLVILRFMVGFFMIFYGWLKMRGKFFDITYAAQDTRLADVDSFYLSWYYFGRSNVQELMIGLMEFIPGMLLLFRRTTFIGAVIMLPVSLNVLLVNTFNHISGLTFPASIFISAANIYIIYAYKSQIIAFLKNIKDPEAPELGMAGRIITRAFKGITVLAIAFLLGINIYSQVVPKHDVSYTFRNKYTGGYELQQLMVNGKPLNPGPGNTRYYQKIYLEPQPRWNAIRTFNQDMAPKAITIQWNAKNDSVTTCLKKNNDVTLDAVDSSTFFKGICRQKDNILTMSGVQGKDTINAVYKKLDLVDYKWFW